MSTFGDVGVPEEREKIVLLVVGFPGCPPIEFGGLSLHSPSHLTFVVATPTTTTFGSLGPSICPRRCLAVLRWLLGASHCRRPQLRPLRPYVDAVGTEGALRVETRGSSDILVLYYYHTNRDWRLRGHLRRDGTEADIPRKIPRSAH
jgi:hypothetical protein